jgi:hypothetical protein
MRGSHAHAHIRTPIFWLGGGRKNKFEPLARCFWSVLKNICWKNWGWLALHESLQVCLWKARNFTKTAHIER